MKQKIALLCISVLLMGGCVESEPVAKHTPADLQNATGQPEDVAVLDDVEPAKAEPLFDQNQEFDNYKEKLLINTWKLNPSYAVYVGYYDHDDQLLVPNGTLRAKQRSFYVNELQALKQFDAYQLNAGNASDLAIIEAQLKSNIWYIDEFRAYEWNPAEYNPAGAFGVILNTDYKPLKERLLVISRRLENVPAFYEAAVNNIKTPTIEHIDLAIQQTGGATNLFSELIPTAVTQMLEKDSNALTEEQVNLLETRLQAAVDACNNYVDWLNAKKQDLLANGNARDFRIGAELYEKKFQHDIGSSYTAAELYELALNAKQSLHDEMIRITDQLWGQYFPDTEKPDQDLVAVKQLIDKLSERHVAREDFVDEIRRQIPIIQAFMDDKDLMDSDPTRPLVVRLTPEYQRGIAGASINAPGPYDATANTYYNVSPLDSYSDEEAESYLREYNHWILQILNIHEAIPGHYTQLMHANKSPSKIKSIFGNGAMVEGWAVYSERMMLEEGYGNNEPEMWLMYSKWNLRVVVNTILDYAVQVLGMEREAGINLLINEAFQQQTEAEGKWRRATLSQVQLTSYFAGYSEIYAFREELKAKLGNAFSLKEFHNEFLSYGNAPVPVIKKLMMANFVKDASLPSDQQGTARSTGQTSSVDDGLETPE